MNIREFANLHHTSVMTVRYYIEEALLTPAKRNGMWFFENADSQKMTDILNYKACGFSLDIIRQLLELNQVTGPGDKTEHMRNLLKIERQRLHREHKELGDAIRLLDSENNCSPQVDRIVQSIPLRLFSLIACPHCNKSLIWDAVCISDNSVRHGTGLCDCGFLATIDNGILYCPGQAIIQTVDTNLETIRKRTAKDISILEKYFLWMFEHLNTLDLAGKVMYEDVINLICFTAKAWPLMDSPPDVVLSDSLPEAVRYYAEALKAIHPDSGILPIVDDGVHHPLRRNSLDLVVDYCSSEIIQAHGFSSVFSIMHEYMKSDAFVLGRFSHLHEERRRPPVAAAADIRYNLHVLKQSMLRNSICIDAELVGEEDLEATIYNSTKPGDVIRPYVFIGHVAADSASSAPSAD